MIHAERNALSNCTIRPENGIAYVTGQCCNDCIMALHQEGIKKVYMRKNHGTFIFDEDHKSRFDLFVEMSKIKIEYIDPDLSWIKNIKL
jgi:deoxycytidylate deaminase